MRRLPIFFLVDVSESMVGENHYRLEQGIGTILNSLRQSPYALETAYIAVIVFAGKARTVLPLTELTVCHPPELPVGGGTALGLALNHLMTEIDRSVIASTPQQKGDWQPIVFLITDGHATDRTDQAVKKWNSLFRQRVNLIAISIGGGADHHVLEQLTETVVVLNDQTPDAFTRFFQWISNSIQIQSRSLSSGPNGPVNLAKTDPDLLAPPEMARNWSNLTPIDQRYAIFVGKCAKTRLSYLVKYQLHLGRIETSDPVLSRLFQLRNYLLETAIPLRQSYFDLSDDLENDQTIRAEDLIGQPDCPHCHASYSLAQCACGKLHCLTGAGVCQCPWCNKFGEYGLSKAEGVEFGRGRG
ncbi:MAG: VWA domain-containing protein [Magnetococcus sp. YQC-9]